MKGRVKELIYESFRWLCRKIHTDEGERKERIAVYYKGGGRYASISIARNYIVRVGNVGIATTIRPMIGRQIIGTISLLSVVT